MSWQLVSFLILGGGLIAGFAWYERRRPPSQVVALVAALAALAIAGRVAFAAFPNVKPTTDIVIFAGFALGGAPGFVVGALTALVSNFWFGQGPWTPWQMAGWGICGLIGAAVGLGWRNVGRFGLAAVCGGAALIYGALLNFSLMATYGYGDLSWERFVILEGRAVPFEVAHVVGNVAFALIAGPAMLRMLVRFRERFEWSRGAAGDGSGRGSGGLPPRLRGGIAALLLVLLSLSPLLAPAPARAAAGNPDRATRWLVSSQNDDGGWASSPGRDSGDETTCWAMLGLEAAGINPRDVRSAGRSPVDFLRAGVADLQHPGDIARTILALQGAGVDPRDFGGHNLVSRLLGKRRKDGSYEGWPGTTAFAVIALRAAGASGGLDKTLSWLRAAQNEDGGWGDLPDAPSTADDTGAAMQALSVGSKASKRGLAYLRGVQRKGGGFPLGGNGEVNSMSTAWAVQGILAAGGDPSSFRRGGVSAFGYLAARQAKDGHYTYSKSSDQTPTWVTGEVLVAAVGKYYPVPPAPRAQQPKPAEQSPPDTPTTSPPSQGSSGTQSGSATSGGIPPTTGVPSSGPGSSAASPGGSAGGGGGTPSGHSAPSDEIPLGESDESTGGASGGGSPTTAPAETSASSQGESSSDSGGTTTLGAILTALLAAVLLAGAAWAARKVWMRQRYGL